MNRPSRLRRSELAVPANNRKMVAKAVASDADLVFLDLEDAVAPAQKVAAREDVVWALRELDWGAHPRAVRVNDAATIWAHGDTISVLEQAGDRVEVLILPKVTAPREVWFFDTLVDQLERRLGLTQRIGFEALIEEAEAIARVDEIAAASPRLEALILGFGVLSASLGVRFGFTSDQAPPYPGDPWHYHRARMVAACRAHGIEAIDGPFGDYRDPDGFRREATWASTLGCTGKWAIHPSQIAIANEVFAPTPRDIERAQRMCRAYEEAERAGSGSAGEGGHLVDAATYRIYHQVLERARRLGLPTDAGAP